MSGTVGLFFCVTSRSRQRKCNLISATFRNIMSLHREHSVSYRAKYQTGWQNIRTNFPRINVVVIKCCVSSLFSFIFIMPFSPKFIPNLKSWQPVALPLSHLRQTYGYLSRRNQSYSCRLCCESAERSVEEGTAGLAPQWPLILDCFQPLSNPLFQHSANPHFEQNPVPWWRRCQQSPGFKKMIAQVPKL